MPLHIVEDTIVTSAGPYDKLSSREENVREALLIVKIVAPLSVSVIIWIFTNKDWTYVSAWTYSRLSMIWFWSFALLTTFVHFQYGVTTRATYALIILQTLVEIVINSLLLHLNFRQAVTAAAICGGFLYSLAIMVPPIKAVYFAVATLSGAVDILLVLILAWAKKWMYATGAFAHMVYGILSLIESTVSSDIILINCLAFLALWLFVGFTTVVILKDTPVQSTLGYIQLPSSMSQRGSSMGTTSGGLNSITAEIETRRRANPLRDVQIPAYPLATMMGLSVGCAFGIALVLDNLA